jgi:hypothetical protein
MPATEMANKPNGQPSDIPEEELDARARKRMEVGLSPRRPTAKAAPQRPPDVQTLPLPPAVLALLLLGVLVVTALLLAVNVAEWRPAWWPLSLTAGPNHTTPATGAIPLAPGGYVLTVSEDFSAPTSTLLQGEQRQEWRTQLLPAESVYQMQVWPGHLAWSLLGLEAVADYRLQTNVMVTTAAPDGYAGLVVRYQGERSFYLLAVDGMGRYLVQLQNGDQAVVVQPWTPVDFLNRAGSANVLTVEDRGDRIGFYGNGLLLYELAGPVLAPGFVGLAAGAQGDEVVEARFDWLQLFHATANDAAQ